MKPTPEPHFYIVILILAIWLIPLVALLVERFMRLVVKLVGW